MTQRYSPRPITEYPGPTASSILSTDEQAWNLAWLSYDFENNRAHPDFNFGVHVRRTLQYVLLTGEADLAGRVPIGLTVRGFFTMPPPKAALQILRMKQRSDLPMYKAYGAQWLVTLEERSHLWRSPFDPAYDYNVDNVDLALQALARFR